MDTASLVCFAIIITCIPLSAYLFHYSYRDFFPKKAKPIIDQKLQPKSIEQALRRGSSHEIPIFEDTGTILAIPNPPKLKKRSRTWQDIVKL